MFVHSHRKHVNEESFVYGGVSFKAYDIGGQEVFESKRCHS